ncbi:MAG: hypothetical protein COA96_10855 [SAR86 cluster bacterium]|uniref:SIMPL domain-containing protein n=1 Tax=SAR86 cluster bacterium TaxID=2030880 RepID=A0A2A5AYK0_9GAMM|nr:MAG: hypothetical protein COA96_10855 [SAR86 cluster bacterium]
MNRFLSMGVLVTAAASITLFSQISLAQAQLSGTPDELREFLHPRANNVSINGEGKLTAYKDLAKVSLVVTTEERSLSAAMTANEELRLRLIEEFTAQGIPASDINNSKFSSSPQFGLFGRRPNSFEVSARMEVSVSSESHLQLLAAAADANEEVEFEQTEYKHSHKDEFEVEVRELALQDVMEQKAYYESSLGLSLKAVNFFHGGIRQFSRSRPMAAVVQEMAVDSLNSRGATVAQTAVVAPTFDEVEYQTSITVVFEIINEN